MQAKAGNGTGPETFAESLALGWVERDVQSRLIVDEDLQYVWSNGAAKSELERRHDLELRDGQLATTNPAFQQQLAGFVESCDGSTCTWALPCEDGDGHVLFRATEIGLDENGQRYIGLMFYRSGSAFTTRYADLDRVFQLTPAEHRVLGRLLNGQTADEVARDLKVSIETTRSHIRQIYTKLAVTSREGLFSKVRPYRI